MGARASVFMYLFRPVDNYTSMHIIMYLVIDFFYEQVRVHAKVCIKNGYM